MCSQWITFSLGMATLVPTQQLITATLMALANPALDQAKSAGRDRNVRLQQPASLFVGLKGKRLMFWDLA